MRSVSVITNSELRTTNYELRTNTRGFTLLEVLVALAILGIAITVVLQLFSANLRSIAASEDYVSAVTTAEARLRDILDDEKLSEKSWSETTSDGYRMDVTVSDALSERTDNLQVKALSIDLTIRWVKGVKEKSIIIKTMKLVEKKV
ncbi:MAG: type II secretion system protein [Nitrospirota bacterium]